MKPLSFCWLPYGDERLASSRLRVYRIHRELLRRGISSTLGFSSSANVAVIQKRIDGAAFLFALKAKLNRALVVYDLDDLENEAGEWRERTKLFLDISDVVVVASEGIREYLLDHGICNPVCSAKIAVIDNAIDYDLTVQSYHKKRTDGIGPIRIYWFGNGCNFLSIKNEFETLWHTLGERISLHVITDDRSVIEGMPYVEFIKWNYDSFCHELSEADVCLLSHFGSRVSLSKTANKMVTSIMLGVPVVASDTPEYSALAKRCGLEAFLFRDAASMVDAVRRLMKVEPRENYLSSAQAIVTNLYALDVITTRLLSSIENSSCDRAGAVIKVFFFFAQMMLRKIAMAR